MIKTDQNTIFITGACGFVGLFLVDLLVRTTTYKLVLNCRYHANRPVQNSKIEYTNADLNDKKALENILETHKPGIVIHLAGITRINDGEQDPNEAFRVNYTGTKSLIELAAKYALNKFVFVSSDMARNHRSVIGITKFLIESYILSLDQTNMQIVTLRLPNISWTPGSVHLIFENQIKKQRPITITHPDMSRRFITGNEAAEYIKYGFEHGTDKDLFVINKAPVKISSLAREMMDESDIYLEIKYIGARPGEKLEEGSYDINEIEHTSFKDLSLLNSRFSESEKITDIIDMLTLKPGFNLNINDIIK